MRSLLLIAGCILFAGQAQASSTISLPATTATPSIIYLGTPEETPILSDEAVASISSERRHYGPPVIIDGNGTAQAQPVPAAPQAASQAPVPPTVRSAPASADDSAAQPEVPPQTDGGQTSSVPSPVGVNAVTPGLVRPL